MLVYLNGEYIPKESAVVPIEDRGFIFGDGIYEVTRAYRGLQFEPDRHQRRLENGLRALKIEHPELDIDVLPAVGDRLLRENGLLEGEALIYTQITRGVAPRTHQFPAGSVRPTVYCAVQPFTPFDDLRRRGATAVTVPDIRWARCDLKTIQLLPNVMAKQQAYAAGAFEAIFVRDGVLMEGSSTSLVGVLDGELRTYPSSNYILPSITREVVLEVAEERGYGVSLAPLYVEDVPRLEELFICSTTTDVMPIVTLDGKPIAGGRPGPVSTSLYEGVHERMVGMGATR